MDFNLPNAVLSFDTVPNTGSLSLVGHAAGILNPRGGGKERSPTVLGWRRKDVGKTDFALPNAVPDTVPNTGSLSEVGHAAGILNPRGGGKERSPTVLGWRRKDVGKMDFVLLNAVTDTVPNTGQLLDRHAGNSDLRGVEAFTHTYDEANRQTEKPQKKPNIVVRVFKRIGEKLMSPFRQNNEVKTLIPSELNADSDNPNLKDDADLASLESKAKISPDKREALKRCNWRGKVKSMPTSQLEADPTIPAVREVVDLADRQSKTNVGPDKKKTSKFNLQKNKVKTVVPSQPLDADPAIPVGMDDADLASREIKTHINFDRPEIKVRIAAANARLQKTHAVPAKFGLKGGRNPKNPGSKVLEYENPEHKDKLGRIKNFLKPSKKKPADHEPGPPMKTFKSKYHLIKSDVLGIGATSKVFKGIRKMDGSEFAVKQICKHEGDRYLQISGYTKPLHTEVALMLKLRAAPVCPYVINMLDWFEDDQRLSLVLPYPEESETLFEYVSSGRKKSESTVRDLMRQAVLAVQHCLDNGVFHTDIHAGNFLIQKTTMKLKLFDFGNGHLLSDDGYDSRDFRGSQFCTPPDIKSSKTFYAMPTNAWALGALLYHMVHGYPPFPLKDFYSGKWKIYDRGLSEEVCNLINWCMAINPSDRPTLKQILDHDWFGPGAKDAEVYRPKSSVYNFLNMNKNKPANHQLGLSIEEFDSKYDLIESDVLGQGPWSIVFKGTHKCNGAEFVIKQIIAHKSDRYLRIPEYEKPVYEEVALMFKVSSGPFCPYVVNMQEWFESMEGFTLVFPYPRESETLDKFVVSESKLRESTARDLMRQAVMAVQHCLENGIFHSDIRAANFLVQKSPMTLKLFNFENGQLLKDDGYDSCNFKGSKICTPPEITSSKKYHAIPANVWALGALLYHMVHGYPPFPLKVFYSGKRKRYAKGLSKEICDLMDWCLAVNPNDRPTLKQILDHEWFNLRFGDTSCLELPYFPDYTVFSGL